MSADADRRDATSHLCEPIDDGRRYAQIEKEALATTWALEHWADLLIGMHFRVETDHLPLVPLLSTTLLDTLPMRIQRFRMRLMRYSFSILHVPGKYLYTADALSRTPLRGTIDRGSEEFQRQCGSRATSGV